jgi:hypothetical protein
VRERRADQSAALAVLNVSSVLSRSLTSFFSLRLYVYLISLPRLASATVVTAASGMPLYAGPKRTSKSGRLDWIVDANASAVAERSLPS